MARLELIPARQRLGAAAVAALLQALLLYALIVGLAVGRGKSLEEALKTFSVAPPPPPPPIAVIPERTHSNKPAGEASPPNLRNKATDVVAPPPPLPLSVPPPVVAAPKPGEGSAASAGAALVAGPGSGAGGQGNGTGAGGSGNGEGDDGDPPEFIGGRPRDSDLPQEFRDNGIGGTVYMRYVIGTDGRMQQCIVRRSSGNAALDAATCRIMQQRLRFRPARDAAGRAVVDYVDGEQEWRVRRVEPQ